MGESVKAEVTKKHGAVPMVTAPTPVPLNKRGIPRMPVVTFENTLMPSMQSQAHGNKLFLFTSTAVDLKKQKSFKSVVADFQHPVDVSFQVYHGHAGVILGPHPPIPAAVTAGVETAPGTECMTELGDLIKKLAKRMLDEMRQPGSFYRNYSDAHDKAAFGAVKDKATGIIEGVKGIGSAIGSGASALYNDFGGTMSRAGNAVVDGAKSVGSAIVDATKETYDLASAIVSGEISIQDLLDEIEASFKELLHAMGCPGRDLAKQMLESETPLSAQLGMAVGAAKAGVAMEVLEGVLVSKGLGTAAKIGAKLAPLGKQLGKFSPKSMMERIRARRNKPRNHKPTPSTTDKKPGGKPTKDEQGKHENVDKGKDDPKKKDCPKGKGTRPVNPILGCKMLFGGEDLDFSLPSAMPLSFQRQYFSDVAYKGWFGQGWTLDFWRQLELTPHHNLMIDDQGRKVYFSRITENNADKRDYNVWDKLHHRLDEKDGYVVETSDGTTYVFGALPTAKNKKAKQLPAPENTRLPLKEIRDRNGNTLKLFYHPETGLPTHLTDAAGRIVALQFAQVGVGDGEAENEPRVRLVEVHKVERVASGKNGQSTFKSIARLAKYEYSPEGDLIRVTNRLGQVTREFEYRNHVMVMHRDAAGLESRYDYNQTEPSGRVLRNYTNTGVEIRFTYDPINRRTVITNQAGLNHTYEYDEAKRFVAEIDAMGGEKRFNYDASNNLIETIDEIGRKTRFTYNGAGSVIAITDAAGGRQFIDYDDRLNAPKQVTDAAGNSWKYVYDDRGNLVSQVDPLGNTTTYRHDARGLPIEITDAKGGVKTLVWNDFAQLESYTDCSKRMTKYEYDTHQQLVAVVDAAGNRTKLHPDVLGRLHAIDHADGSREQFAYDAANRLIGYRDPLGQETHYTLNVHGLPIARRDALGHTLGYRYDSLDRLIELANENQATATFTYDANDQLIAETGFDARIQRYAYNAAGELTEKLDGGTLDELSSNKSIDSDSRPPDPFAARFTESNNASADRAAIASADGAAFASSDGTAIRTVYRRDTLGRLIEKVTPSGATRYQYDELGQLAHAINDKAKLTWKYDKLGQVLEETSLVRGIESSLKHGYDPLGNRTSLTLPDGRVLNYLYYGSGHLHHINLDGETIADIERDALHREVERTQGALTHAYRYDAMGRLVEQRASRVSAHPELVEGRGSARAAGAGEGLPRTAIGSTAGKQPSPGDVKSQTLSAIIHRQYRYDAAGHLNEILDPRRGRTSYHYDPLGRLTDATRSGVKATASAERFAFDPAHNMIAPAANSPSARGERVEPRSAGEGKSVQQNSARSTGFVKNNRLEIFEDKRFKYDPHGNLIEKKIGSHTILAFRYDAEHQLIECDSTRFANDDKKRIQQIVKFDYDALGRRVSKTTPFHSTQFLWDGNRLLSEARSVIPSPLRGEGAATAAGEGEVRARAHARTLTHVYEPDSFVPLARIVIEASSPDVYPAMTGDTTDNDNYQPTDKNTSNAQYQRASLGRADNRFAAQEISSAKRKNDIVDDDDDDRDDSDDDNDDDLALENFTIDPRAVMNMPAKDRSFILKGMTSKLRRHGQAIALKNKQQQGLAPLGKAQTIHRIEYYQTDHLGTPQELTASNGQVIWQATYAAWGNTLRIETIDPDEAQQFAALTDNDESSAARGSNPLPPRGGESRAAGREGATQPNAAMPARASTRTRVTPHHDITEQRFEQQTKREAANEAAFGQRDSQQQNLRFQGQYFDEETGLHYNRFRYYDPDVGRFINQDKAKFAGGDNFYQYAPSAINWIDPHGLTRLRPTDPAAGSLTDVQTRCWYLREETRIPCQINSSLSRKQQARQAALARNEARTRARLLMQDRQKAIGLHASDPNLTFKQLMALKKAKKNLEGADAHQDIIDSAQKSRESVNKALLSGLDCEKILKDAGI